MQSFTHWVNRLAGELSNPLPGNEAQLIMSPRKYRPVDAARKLRNSGVLLLLYPYHERIHTVFIKRNEYPGIHSGQIGFPGGMAEKDDASLSATALREAEEEIGIKANDVNIIGQLTALHIPVSNTMVFPFVAACKRRPEFMPDQNEVQFVIETPIDELMDESNRKSEMLQVAGMSMEVPYFDIQGHHIWGATAMMVSEFLEVAKRII